MGEFAVENFDPRLGSTNWADWTNQASNRPLIVSQVTQLVPVQEMLPFQRIIRTRALQQVVIVNEKVTYSVTPPDDEAWRILAVSAKHNNNVDVQFVLDLIAVIQTSFVYEANHTVLNPNQQTPLYPASSGSTDDSRSQTKTGPPLEVYPGDTLRIRTLTGWGAVPGVTELSVRYELIPLPLRQELDTFITGAASA